LVFKKIKNRPSIKPPLYKLLSRVLSIQCGTWVFPNTGRGSGRKGEEGMAGKGVRWGGRGGFWAFNYVKKPH